MYSPDQQRRRRRANSILTACGRGVHAVGLWCAIWGCRQRNRHIAAGRGFHFDCFISDLVVALRPITPPPGRVVWSVRPSWYS